MREAPYDSGRNPYEVLEVAETASAEQIRKAYLAKVRQHPPESEPEEFRRIREAYGRLKDEAERRRLDLSVFRREPDFTPNRNTDQAADPTAADDFTRLYRERIFKVLLASSDLYEEDFRRAFRNLDDRIRGLK